MSKNISCLMLYPNTTYMNSYILYIKLCFFLGPWNTRRTYLKRWEIFGNNINPTKTHALGYKFNTSVWKNIHVISKRIKTPQNSIDKQTEPYFPCFLSASLCINMIWLINWNNKRFAYRHMTAKNNIKSPKWQILPK